MDVVAAQAHDRHRAGAVLLDVREPFEFHAGHVPDATNIPLGRLGAEHATLPRDREILVICATGNRSATATSSLRRLGYDAFNVAGGMAAWQGKGLPVARSRAA